MTFWLVNLATIWIVRDHLVSRANLTWPMSTTKAGGNDAGVFCVPLQPSVQAVVKEGTYIHHVYSDEIAQPFLWYVFTNAVVIYAF